jgi:threonylcarbamoyladenosine tRNA methylthiotransferase MtaB
MAAGIGFHTLTLGCKLNRFDSAALEGELIRRGFRPEADIAGSAVVIVNTCTVTSSADADSRKLIRRIRRINPSCRLLVTGCYAERDPEAVRSLTGVDLIVGNAEKKDVPSVLDRLGLTVAPEGGDSGCRVRDEAEGALHFGDRGRAYLKVQEGCDLSCSYCIIPRVRGASRSVPPERIEAHLLSLLRDGYREIVLTGVNTGDYGRDLEPTVSLSALLRRLLDRCGASRLRLNSLEPLTITSDIIALFRDESRLARHLQVPLQSGSDAVLRRMRRNYRRATYLDRIEKLHAVVPGIGLGADVIVGFPGETDGDFDQTLRFIEAAPLAYLHVFSWSPRPGTDAAGFAGHVPAETVRERSRRLRALGAEKAWRFRRSFEGKTLEAVALGGTDSSGRQRVLTSNFIEAEIEPGSAVPRSLVTVTITRAGSDRTLARVSDGLSDSSLRGSPR